MRAHGRSYDRPVGLFRRREANKAHVVDPDLRPHSHVALAPEDVEASKRCKPIGDLADFAAERGLTFGGSIIVGSFVGILPNWPNYVFNSCRGTLAGRRYGLVEHELLELPVTPDDDGSGIHMGGSFWAVRQGFPPDWKKRMIPGVTELGLAEPGNEPFASIAIWAPTTTVAVHVPEAALLKQLLVKPADRMAPIGSPKLEEYGLPNFRIDRPDDQPPEVLAGIFGGEAGRVLGQIDAPFVELRMHHSQLTIKRNGFVEDHAELDVLIEQAVKIADGIAAVCRPDPTSRPFDVSFPPPPDETGRFAGLDRWDATLDAAAAKFNLVREDPAAYHEAFPRLEIPGTARGVLRGSLPGGGTHGRLAFHEQGGRRSGWLKAAALFAAPEGAQPTPPGGVLHENTAMYVSVADGLVACWNQQMDPGELSVTSTAERGQATIRELGLLRA
jgi:hypothetical protein